MSLYHGRGPSANALGQETMPDWLRRSHEAFPPEAPYPINSPQLARDRERMLTYFRRNPREEYFREITRHPSAAAGTLSHHRSGMEVCITRRTESATDVVYQTFRFRADHDDVWSRHTAPDLEWPIKDRERIEGLLRYEAACRNREEDARLFSFCEAAASEPRPPGRPWHPLIAYTETHKVSKLGTTIVGLTNGEASR